MASNQPIIRQIKYISILLQLAMLTLLIIIFYLIRVGDPVILGSITYLIIFLGTRNLIPRNHRRGIRFFKNMDYGNAVKEFESSYLFFTKYKWIDKYRIIVMLSSSRISYTEMALLNMAFCYGQLGNGLKSKELYERTLAEFPSSQMAITALNMFYSAENINLEKNNNI